MRAAISGMGSSRARRAISRSGGNVTAMSAASSYEQARERVLPPALGGLDPVEREEMQAPNLSIGSGEVGLEEAVAFRVAGDTDPAKAVRLGGDRRQERHGGREIPCRFFGISGDDEHLAPPQRVHPRQDLSQMRVVSDQAR